MSEYLVAHGCGGHLGRFRWEPAEELARGSAVVVSGRRGPELGDVLCAAGDGAALPDPFVGELLRRATAVDYAAAERGRMLGQMLFDDVLARTEQRF